METRQNHTAFWLIAILIVTPLLFYVGFNVLWAYGWRHTTQRATLPTISDWPEPVQDLHAAMEDSGADTSSFSVYLLHGKPAQVLSTVVCRVSVDDVGWDTIASTLDLQPIPASDGHSLHSAIVPLSDASWWPAVESESEYFASARLLAGDEADLYQAALDNDSNTAYVHYHFNF